MSPDGTAFAVDQPQALAGNGNQLAARAAVWVTPQSEAGPRFGTFTISGTTAVHNEVALVSFPALPDHATAFGIAMAAQASEMDRHLRRGRDGGHFARGAGVLRG